MMWKCADGGVHEGKDCHEEFRKMLKHTAVRHDIPLVRLPDALTLSNRSGLDLTATAKVLEALIALTPTNAAQWKVLHEV